MIECIFTLDYEIYGNGTGALSPLVYEPAQRLAGLFRKWDARFVAFVEAVELAKIRECATDSAIGSVEQQLREFRQCGFEIALHIHPQWSNARYQQGRWLLDYSEYNLCTLSRSRIAEIVDDAINYLRNVLREPNFNPLSFRAGNWLFQPTETAAGVLATYGIRIDSSVFKGGRLHNYRLDYRDALKNGYYWPFEREATKPDVRGAWIEVPIYTEMVPPWKMSTSKRVGFNGGLGVSSGSFRQRTNRALDLLRPRYPLKFDFCRMTLAELTSMLNRVIREDEGDAGTYRPLVAIGHTKDLSDPQTVDAFLSFLRAKDIGVVTFEDIYPRLAKIDRSPTSIGSVSTQN